MPGLKFKVLRLPILLLAAYVATFIDQGLSSAVSVALPSIAGALGAPGDEALSSNVSFSTAYYVSILLTPWLITRFGSKRHYVLALGGVAIASFFCSQSSTFGAFTLWRLLEGIALGGVFVNTLWSIFNNTSPTFMRYAFGLYGAFSLSGPALGPLFGGLAVDAWTWRELFAGVGVLSLLASISLGITLKEPTPVKSEPFDLVGVVLLGIACFGYNVATQFGELHDWLGDQTIAAFSVVTACGLVAFILWELYGSTAPMLPLRILAHRGLRISLLLGVGLGVPLFAATVFLSYLQGSLQFTSTLAGQLIALRIVTIALFAPAFSIMNSLELVDTRLIVAFGFVCTAVSYALQAAITTTDSTFPAFISSVLISGIGFSAIFSPLVFSTVLAVGTQFAPVTAALLKISFTVGGSLANSALATIVDHRAAQHYADLASAVVASRPAVAALVYLHSQQRLVALAQLVADQARTFALADAAWVTAIATIAFLPFARFLPTARDETSPTSENAGLGPSPPASKLHSDVRNAPNALARAELDGS